MLCDLAALLHTLVFSPLQEFLHHLRIGHVTHLTRSEWSIIRSAFGRPRRLSLTFLKEERLKLESFREAVRHKYEECGPGMEVPPEVPRPLRVGQEVTARHPVTRQIHDGVILTVKGSKYRWADL
jgi:DIRP